MEKLRKKGGQPHQRCEGCRKKKVHDWDIHQVDDYQLMIASLFICCDLCFKQSPQTCVILSFFNDEPNFVAILNQFFCLFFLSFTITFKEHFQKDLPCPRL